jgi:undecaprenyl-diphosphatase
MLALAAVSNHGFTTLRSIILGLLQGISELFPISSLGHTVLFPTLFGWQRIVAFQAKPESPWLAFIVMLHVGSAVGLLIYFWRDWVKLIAAFFRTLAKRRIETAQERLIWLLIVASIPTGILGLLLEHDARTATAKPEIAAILLVVNGVILAAAEQLRRRVGLRWLGRRRARRAATGRELADLSFLEAAALGVAQSGGLMGGISRDGMVMAAGLELDLDNYNAARISFLMATPIILAAGIFKVGDLTGPNGAGIRGAAVIAAVFAALSAILTVHFLSRFFRRGNLYPFAAYCVLFGAAMIGYTTS